MKARLRSSGKIVEVELFRLNAVYRDSQNGKYYSRFDLIFEGLESDSIDTN